MKDWGDHDRTEDKWLRAEFLLLLLCYATAGVTVIGTVVSW
jgi:hypothetical protein